MSAVLAEIAATCVCGHEHVCGCGCGGELNPNIRRVHEFAASGASTGRIAEAIGVSPSFVKVIRNGRYSPRFLPGHVARTVARTASPRTALRLAPCPPIRCGRCGEKRGSELFVFVRKDGALSGHRFSWCLPCREAVDQAPCARCKQTKPREAFYAHPGRSCGLSSYCVECQTASANASVERFRQRRQQLSDANPVLLPGELPGICRAFVNLGAFRPVRCSRRASSGGYCARHASPDQRRIASDIRRRHREGPSPREWERILARRRCEREEAIAANPELADLVASQERDDKWGSTVGQRLFGWRGPTTMSLDSREKGGDEKQGGLGLERHEYLEIGEDLDPAVILEAQEESARLFALAGFTDADDVLRVDGETLAWMQEKLRAEGYAPRGVQQAERGRLRVPAPHTGVEKAPLIPGRRTRRQKREHKAANRARGNSNRPSQKPRKRWERSEEIA